MSLAHGAAIARLEDKVERLTARIEELEAALTDPDPKRRGRKTQENPEHV